MILKRKRRLRLYCVNPVLSDRNVILFVFGTHTDSVRVVRKVRLLHHVGHHERKVYVKWLELRVQKSSGDNVCRRVALKVQRLLTVQQLVEYFLLQICQLLLVFLHLSELKALANQLMVQQRRKIG